MENKLFSKKDRRTYEHICCLTERGVMQMMAMFLRSRYKNINITPSYIIAIGDIPIGLCAHADTVFPKPPKDTEFYYDTEKNVIWNSGGAGADDRAGRFSIIYLLRNYSELKPYIFITTGEETFCMGSNKLCAHFPEFPYKLKYLIQLDRRGHDDAVYYECANADFENYINKFGFKTALGSYTDISVLAPHFKCAAVNLSIGYIDEHSRIERLYVNHMFETIDKVVKILKDEPNSSYYEYIEAPIYNPFKFEGDSVICNNCSQPVKIQDVLPLYSLKDKKYINICLNCYAKIFDRIAWCDKCYKGFLFTKPVEDQFYVCDECKDN